jgi:preprotein translocase subunit SecG
MLLGLLLTLNIMVCLALIGVVLLQRSEGGALGTGGSPTGLITTRGAGDLLTRTTWVLFAIFLTLSLSLTLLGGRARSDQAAVDAYKGLTINPDAQRKASNGPKAAPGATPGAPGGQAAPSPVQLPPLTGGGSSSQTIHATPDRGARPPTSTSALVLPPLASSPAPAPAPATNSPK